MIRRWDKSRPPTGPFTLNKDCLQAGNLVAWYPFGQAAGGNFAPDMTSTYHLNDAGVTAPGWNVGKYGEPVIQTLAASAQSLERASSPIAGSGTSLTLAAWAMPTDNSIVMTMLSCATLASNQGYMLVIVGTAANDPFWGQSTGASLTGNAEILNPTFNVWSHYLCNFTTTSSRTAYINGVSGTNDGVDTGAVSGVNRIGVGAIRRLAGFQFPFSGMIGESAIWAPEVSTQVIKRLNDPGLRFELWYPLRSKKWISVGSGITADLSKTLGAATLSSGAALAIAASASKTLGALSITSVTQLALAAASANTLSAATLSATGSLAIADALTATLGAATLASTGTLAIAGALTQTLGAVTLSSATSLGGITADLSKTLGAASLTASGTLAIAAALTQTLGAESLTSAAALKIAAASSVTLGGIALSSLVTGLAGADSPGTIELSDSVVYRVTVADVAMNTIAVSDAPAQYR